MRNEGKPVAAIFNAQVWRVMIPAVHPDNEAPVRLYPFGAFSFKANTDDYRAFICLDMLIII